MALCQWHILNWAGSSSVWTYFLENWILLWVLGSYGGYVFVKDAIKWAILQTEIENIYLVTFIRALVSISSKNNCGRENCSISIFNFCLLLISTFCLFRYIGPFLFCATSATGCLTFNRLSFFDISILLNSFGAL